MSSRAQVYFMGLLLILLGIGLVIYKSQILGLPIFPGEYETVWTVEAKIEFNAKNAPVKASLALPKHQSTMEIIDEVFSSSGYGFTIESNTLHRRAIWTTREAAGKQSLYYKIHAFQLRHPSASAPPVSYDMTEDNHSNDTDGNAQDSSVDAPSPYWSGSRRAAVQSAAMSLINKARGLSSDKESFAAQLLTELASDQNNDSILIRSDQNNREYVSIALDLLSLAGIPARIIRGLYLEDDRHRLPPVNLIEIYNDTGWVVFDPVSGSKGLPHNFLIWQRGDISLLDVEGGTRSRVSFSVLANDIPVREAALKLMGATTAAIIDYSIYSLPIEQQSIFKSILLVPVGALIVILLRVVVGVRTAGTFMPVLLAIAFIQTTLVTGISIFLLILSIGLWTRSYLSRLDLLLVARIAAVIVMVVGMIAVLSIASYKLGIKQALTVTFFPMIILAWTIEHMSILWEDDGPLEVLIQTAGSLLVAILSYIVMTNHFVEHWVFNFPELLFAVLGIILMLGNYTGYRLSELIRFRHMRAE